MLFVRNAINPAMSSSHRPFHLRLRNSMPVKAAMYSKRSNVEGWMEDRIPLVKASFLGLKNNWNRMVGKAARNNAIKKNGNFLFRLIRIKMVNNVAATRPSVLAKLISPVKSPHKIISSEIKHTNAHNK